MFKTVSILALSGLLTLSTLQAQSSRPVEAHVPFAFQMQHRTYAAGTYRLTYNPNSSLLLQGRDKNPQAGLVIVAPALRHRQGGEQSKLIFHCYGGTCYLTEVWQSAASGGSGLQLPQSEPKDAIALATRAVLVEIPAK